MGQSAIFRKRETFYVPTHRIRLIGPWEYAWTPTASLPTEVNEASDVPATGNVRMPCDWLSLFGTKSGVATFSRRFHRPTNLEPHERVFLVFEGIGGAGRVGLNDEPLGQVALTDRTIEFDVTGRLAPFNRMDVELQFTPSETAPTQGGLYGAVVLEIRS